MRELLITGEVIAAVIVLLVLALAGLIVRRQTIARSGPLSLAALERQPGSWRLGFVRVAHDDIRWYPLVGVTTRAARRWQRGDLVLGAPSTEGTPRVPIPDMVVVECRAAGGQFRLALSAGDYTAVRSWSESAPPGLNANVAS